MVFTARKRVIWLFLLPALLFYTAFMAIPLFGSVVLSLFTGKGLVPTEFVGLRNFISLFTALPYNERFFNALVNNLKFFFFVWLFQNVSGFLIAILVTRKVPVFFRRISFLPTTLSVVVAGFLFSLFLNPIWGFVDSILKALGMGFLIRSWLGDPGIALIVIALIVAWQYMGIPILFFAASIDNIDVGIFDAGKIDGASILQTVRYIILPLSVPTIGTITILTFIGNFTQFDIIYAMASSLGDPAYSTDIFGTLFYRAAFGSPDRGGWGMGMGSSVATMMFIVVLAGVLLWMRLFRRISRKIGEG
jgi:raffinose/stachyose/melibiose transport system permease protein